MATRLVEKAIFESLITECINFKCRISQSRRNCNMTVEDLLLEIAKDLRAVARYAGSDEERDTWQAAAEHVENYMPQITTRLAEIP